MKVEELNQLETESKYSILCNISRELTRPAPLEEVLEKTADLMAKFFYPDGIRIYLWNDKEDKLKLKVSRGLSEAFLKQVQEIPLGKGYSGVAIRQGRPLGMDVSEFPDEERKILFRKEGIKSVLAIPLQLKGCILGVLNVASTRNYDFFLDKLDFLCAIGSQISIAIDHAKLFEEKIEQERLKAALELERALAQIGRLAAIGEITTKISHEFRTCLTVIGGFARRILKKCSPEDKKYIDIVLSEISRLENIISNLTCLVEEKSHPQKTNINQLIEDSAQLFMDQFEEKNILLQKVLDKKLPEAFVDPGQIKHVLIFIIKNILDVMSDGGNILVKTTRQNNFVQIIIEDNGPQIPQEDLIRLFCSFVTGKPRGVGLGLSIAQQIIEGNKGIFSIANKEGKGVIHQIQLPLN